MLDVLSVHFLISTSFELHFNSNNRYYKLLNNVTITPLSENVYLFFLVSCSSFALLKYQNEVYVIITMIILWNKPNCI